MGKRGTRIEAWWKIVKARKMRDEGLSLHQIADILNCKHTTVVYYLKKYNDYYQYDAEFRDMVRMYEEEPTLSIQGVIVSAQKVVEVCKKELGTGGEFWKIMRQLGIII